MNFRDFQLLHLVRQAELSLERSSAPVFDWAEPVASSAKPIEADLRESSQPFATKARLRAVQIAQVSGLSKLYGAFLQRTKTVSLVLFMLMAMLGFMTTLQTMNSSDNQLNIYWLLLLLLGVNALSMLLWLAFIVRGALRRATDNTVSPILAAFHWLVAKLPQGRNQGLLFANWADTHLLGTVGKWTNSQLLHSAWLSYLVGGLFALLLTFSGKQYDFVWGSTILPDTVFVQATQKLAVLPHKLGFAVPDAAQILATQTLRNTEATTASSLSADSQLRSHWASFLLGCIMVYGLLPRLLCWLLSSLMLWVARRRCAVDWEQAYFFQMRMRLQAESTALGVVDADTQPTDQRKPALVDQAVVSQNIITLSDLHLPENSVVAAFEWGDATVPALPITAQQFFGTIDDSAAQQKLLQQIDYRKSSLCLLVALERVADRGATRFLQQLTQHCDLSLLVVKRETAASDLARWSAWKMVAERIALPEQKVQLLSLVASSTDLDGL